jgi:hypothetical protein
MADVDWLPVGFGRRMLCPAKEVQLIDNDDITMLSIVLISIQILVTTFEAKSRTFG